MPALTASALPRVLRCVPSAVLPQDEMPDNEWSSRGDDLHGQLERGELDIDLPDGTRHEIAFAFDISTGRGRELDIEGRNYAAANLGMFEIPGRADVWGPGLVADAKSGFRDVDPPARNAQVLIAACANADIHEVGEVECGIIDIRNPDEPRARWAHVDFFELETFRARLQNVIEEAAALRQGDIELSDVITGEHCRYCPAASHCPAKKALVQRAGDGSLAQEVEVAWAGSLTPASAPSAYRQWRALKMIEKRMSDILHAYASDGHTIELGDGKVFGKRTTQGNEKLDGKAVFDALQEHYGLDVALKAVEFASSKRAIRDALRPIAARGEMTKRMDAILKAVRDAGGSSRKETSKIEEYKKKVAR